MFGNLVDDLGDGLGWYLFGWCLLRVGWWVGVELWDLVEVSWGMFYWVYVYEDDFVCRR